MAISKKVKNSLNGASWVRRMFEEGRRMKRIYGEENVYDFSLGNPNLEPPCLPEEGPESPCRSPNPGNASLYAEQRIQ